VTAIDRLARFSLTTADARGLAAFYERALGFRPVSVERNLDARTCEPLGVAGGATRTVLRLGEEIVELLAFETPGEPYPDGVAAFDLLFQHFAIVVADMASAYARLVAAEGWTAITEGGPQRLPTSSGGVAAFKFRDPDGHPLELLAFPERETPPHWRRRRAADPCLGIDHSALSVADDARSIAFYKALGLIVSAQTFNHRAAQGRLDGLIAPKVEVTALSPRRATPHLELLCYRVNERPPRGPLRNNDIAATRLVFEAPPDLIGPDAEVGRRGLVDPDGHHLVIEAPRE
jgi:catechol 2,3-dioxygenase-like lactoylglutathione lyase family enzyme